MPDPFIQIIGMQLLKDLRTLRGFGLSFCHHGFEDYYSRRLPCPLCCAIADTKRVLENGQRCEL